MKKYIFFVLLILMFAVSSVSAQEQAAGNGNGYGGLIEKSDGTLINWGNGFLSASSSIKLLPGSIDPARSKALAVRQGGVESRKKLLDMVLSLPLDSRRNVSSLIKDDIKSLNSLRGYVQNSLLNTAVDGNGTVAVTSSLNLRNGLSSIIIPPTLSFQTGIPPTISGERGETGTELQALESEENGYIDSSIYSGVLIDARGLNYKPVLLPLIYDGRGVGVYGPFAVSRESVLKRGLVTYMTDDKSENLRSRVGNFPLKVKAVNTHGTSRSNFILSLEDATKVRAVLKRKIVSENCSVVILVDKAAGAANNGESADSLDEEQSQDIDAVNDDSEIQEESLDANPTDHNQQR
ncbi:hypothetical protein [Maridesulfovibrio salexigens]|uniref:LPP20 lipoprotein n=1 Tax=Maridesulfovibrio salexigens (strain ATCC 14822 / DSM 2638 / NCIMB 8403 / VKM B-1763) TaxID=526222 RepID=C6BXF9_MARSD|nr:hypothetical protein [Maridesulfovibrio salexigens]ACS80465.1 hypothetical protein Desal_2409 [Maridesulfovibrio salexigens DSM 2638]